MQHLVAGWLGLLFSQCHCTRERSEHISRVHTFTNITIVSKIFLALPSDCLFHLLAKQFLLNAYINLGTCITHSPTPTMQLITVRQTTPPHFHLTPKNPLTAPFHPGHPLLHSPRHPRRQTRRRPSLGPSNSLLRPLHLLRPQHSTYPPLLRPHI